MAFNTSPIEVALKAKDKIIDPRDKKTLPQERNYYQWWNAQDEKTLCSQLLSTTAFLKNYHSARIRQASMYSRLYSGKPLYNYLASTSTLDNSQQMPMGRPTANVVYQCIDTLTSMITQDRPRPTFLTNGGDYQEQRLSQELNDFMLGEFFRCKTYDKGAQIFRDSGVLGNGFIKCVKKDDKVHHQRTLETELLVDFNDGYYGDPRGLIHTKMCDRGVLMDELPEADESKIMMAQGGTVDSSPQSTDTVTDQLIVAEGWHLPSGEKAKDGRHVIVCSEGTLLDEPWNKQYFPFAKLDYNQNTIGWFSQGLAEILFPTQMEIYKMLIIASQAIEMSGVPKIVISELSKVLETAFNNNISTIIKTKTMAEAPQFINPTSNNPEIYTYIDWLIANAKNMSGLSDQSTSGEVTRGVESGEAQRTQQDIQAQRFAALQRRYQNFYTDLAYIHIDMAKDIAEETGSYTSVYPGRDGTREVELPKMSILEDTYIIQCYDESALPKDPVGRQSKLSEMLAAGEINIQEFRRMSRFPDLEQSDKLAVALENRILHDLGQIIDEGEYSHPDEFMLDPEDLATKLTVQTINKYAVTNIEDEKMKMLYDYFTQIQGLKMKAQAAMAPPPQQGPLPVAPPQASNSPTSNVKV